MRRYELKKSFGFEAAHWLGNTALGPVSEEIHGHSFRAEITVRGTPDPNTGMIIDLVGLELSLQELRRSLDHKYLNSLPGLGIPTLERIAEWVGERCGGLPNLVSVTIRRDSCGESATVFFDD